MKVKYDLHLHTALSPCADKNMTPSTVVGFAKLNGLDIIAISDHNSIFNVEAAMKAGEHFGIVVVPAIEAQSSEGIHLLCFFKNFLNLKNFFEKLCFFRIKNRPEIFGEQLIIDEEDNIIGEVDDYLVTSAEQSASEILTLAKSFGGIAIPSHIEREGTGMLYVLGTIPEEFIIVEVSKFASEELKMQYQKSHKVIFNSDSHQLQSIIAKNELELKDKSIEALFQWFEQME